MSTPDGTTGGHSEIEFKKESSVRRNNIIIQPMTAHFAQNLSKNMKSDIDWFGFETRIRKVVYELLDQPMENIKRVATHFSNI